MGTLRTLGIACGATRRRLRRDDDRLESAVSTAITTTISTAFTASAISTAFTASAIASAAIATGALIPPLPPPKQWSDRRLSHLNGREIRPHRHW